MALPPVAAPARWPPAEADLVEGKGIVLPDLSLTGLPKTSGGGAILPPFTLIGGLPKTSGGGGLARSAGLDIYF